MKGHMCKGLLRAVLPAALLFLQLSCSVKENRDACPCYVYLMVDEFISAGFSEASVSFLGSGEERSAEDVELAPYAGEGYIKALPRGKAEVSVAAGLLNSELQGAVLTTPPGEEADPLWLARMSFICEGDWIRISPEPAKQFCRLTIVMLSPDGKEADLEKYFLRVSANCHGMDLYTGEVIAGPFCAEAKSMGGGVYTIRIPRQLSSELTMEIGLVGEEKSDPYVFDLGKEFIDAGYDWYRTNLLDASALVDYANAEIHVSIEDWDVDDSFNDVVI